MAALAAGLKFPAHFRDDGLLGLDEAIEVVGGGHGGVRGGEQLATVFMVMSAVIVLVAAGLIVPWITEA
ncbi:hypothetical protein N825_25735 [Skermanella stibiiresistens SB22]|uniref:Uncharacterized protein n=1 Tax=Skermanella stibiiresistens SB22 TaxID=1385369 RepID=W9GVS2_9PROT|nr:hypothetical protein N825_25735 [Skermanella stibiiresistens SB22]